MRFVNVNDGSCEGLDYPGKRAFSLQFHPEAHGGPLDCSGMFDRFIAMMGGVKPMPKDKQHKKGRSS